MAAESSDRDSAKAASPKPEQAEDAAAASTASEIAGPSTETAPETNSSPGAEAGITPDAGAEAADADGGMSTETPGSAATSAPKADLSKTDSAKETTELATEPAGSAAPPPPKTDLPNTDSAKETTESPASADAEPAPESGRYSPALIATAVALPIALVVAVLVIAVLASRAPTEREPLVLGPVPAPAADGPACTALLPALPVDLGDYTKSTLVEPAPPATRAWQRKDGGDPVVLRCGLDRPLEFNRASALQIVNGVQWFEARDPAAKASTWFAVDRESYIALTVPDGSGPTPLQGVSDAITAQLPARAIDPGPLPN